MTLQRLFPFKKPPSPRYIPHPANINPTPKLNYLGITGSAQGIQPRKNVLQSTITHPIILPKKTTNLPKESILKIPSPPLQTPNLFQIIQTKRIIAIFLSISQTSPTPPYLDSRISFHKLPLSVPRCQIHLLNKAALKTLGSRIPRLPDS